MIENTSFENDSAYLEKRLFFFQKGMKPIVTMLPFGLFLKRFFIAVSFWDMSFFFFIFTNISVDHKKSKKAIKSPILVQFTC